MSIRYLPFTWFPRRNGSNKSYELSNIPASKWPHWTRPCHNGSRWPTWSYSFQIRVTIDGSESKFNYLMKNLTNVFILPSHGRTVMLVKIVKVVKVLYTHQRLNMMIQLIVLKKINMWANVFHNFVEVIKVRLISSSDVILGLIRKVVRYMAVQDLNMMIQLIVHLKMINMVLNMVHHTAMIIMDLVDQLVVVVLVCN